MRQISFYHCGRHYVPDVDGDWKAMPRCNWRRSGTEFTTVPTHDVGVVIVWSIRLCRVLDACLSTLCTIGHDVSALYYLVRLFSLSRGDIACLGTLRAICNWYIVQGACCMFRHFACDLYLIHSFFVQGACCMFKHFACDSLWIPAGLCKGRFANKRNLRSHAHSSDW